MKASGNKITWPPIWKDDLCRGAHSVTITPLMLQCALLFDSKWAVTHAGRLPGWVLRISCDYHLQEGKENGAIFPSSFFDFFQSQTESRFGSGLSPEGAVRCGAVCWELNLQVGDAERSGIFKMPPAGSDHGSRIRILWASSFKGAVQEQDRTLSGIWLSVLPWGSFPLKRLPPRCQQHPSRSDYLSDFRPLKWLSQSLFFVSLQHFATVI